MNACAIKLELKDRDSKITVSVKGRDVGKAVDQLIGELRKSNLLHDGQDSQIAAVQAITADLQDALTEIFALRNQAENALQALRDNEPDRAALILAGARFGAAVPPVIAQVA